MNPISVFYDHGFPVYYTWDGKGEDLATVLNRIKDDNGSRNLVYKILLRLFRESEPFRKAILDIEIDAINGELIDADSLPREAVGTYIDCLAHFAEVAKKVVNCRPEEILPMMADFVDAVNEARFHWFMTDVDIAELLSEFNIHADALSKYMLTLLETKFEASAPEGRPTPLRPVTFLGWGGPDSVGQSYGLNAGTFKDGFVEIRCDNWSEHGGVSRVIGDWCSGVKVVASDAESVTLVLDKSRVKQEVPIGGGMVPTKECGEYVMAIEECGEFNVDIYYKPEIDSADKVHIFSYDYCCK